ncbi:SHOCT domain-containing protein [Streptomyces sp. NBC_00285]|uniref:SHOCT domain-containing protein n=1 Tax=Streptomyces sp. NBC_00285 TaxID=2975700 RepID=UPI002E2C91B5|nr:SHOCT domain-containing protein [Streptomyces sp. NBC_00285]
MMIWSDHGTSTWGWIAMSTGMVLFWALIVGVGVLLFRSLGRTTGPHHTHHHTTTPPPSPEKLLAERFARGDIDTQEYQQRLTTLQSTGPRPPLAKRG